MLDDHDPQRHVSLRSTLARLTTVVAVLAALVAGALVVLTTVIQRNTRSIAEAVESVRLVEDAAIDLLLHERARDPLVRHDLETDLDRKLREAREYVATPDERRKLDVAEVRVAAYLEAAGEPQRSPAERAAGQEAAYAALEELVEINVHQARAAEREAARWNDLANVVGVAAGVLVAGLAGALLLWLKRRAFEPILELAAAMERFGRGEHDTRAQEQGPRELREMCRRFNGMASALAVQRQAQMAFLGAVAHDLRNPLSALQLSVAVLRVGDPASSPMLVRQTVDRIERQLTRMERMLGDFLDIARIEAGQLELRIDAHDAVMLVTEAVELLQATSRDHHVELRLPTHPVPLHCDHLRIEQVIINLVSNAIKYSPPGSAIEVELVSRSDELELRVTDHGVGISTGDRAHLFEPFRRLASSAQGVPGVGLGLYAVRKIVEAHGGWIGVESAPGAGSTFRVRLPLSPGA